MTKVFQLTIVPATRRSKELFVLCCAPGVTTAMLARAADRLDALGQKRGADTILLTDCDVTVKPRPNLLRRLQAAFIKRGKPEQDIAAFATKPPAPEVIHLFRQTITDYGATETKGD